MLIMQINEDHEVMLRREGTLGFLSVSLIVAAARMIRVCGAICRRDRAQVHKEGVSGVDCGDNAVHADATKPKRVQCIRSVSLCHQVRTVRQAKKRPFSWTTQDPGSANMHNSGTHCAAMTKRPREVSLSPRSRSPVPILFAGDRAVGCRY